MENYNGKGLIFRKNQEMNSYLKLKKTKGGRMKRPPIDWISLVLVAVVFFSVLSGVLADFSYFENDKNITKLVYRIFLRLVVSVFLVAVFVSLIRKKEKKLFLIKLFYVFLLATELLYYYLASVNQTLGSVGDHFGVIFIIAMTGFLLLIVHKSSRKKDQEIISHKK